MNRHDKEGETPAELESQFIIRMPAEPAKTLREALISGANLRDRFTIRLENDIRYGEVRVDHWLMPAKVLDLPTIIESLKTIDNKSFYKTADICQMLICREEDDQPTDEESPQKTKKKDPNKVDKKFLWPHGITPPTKNVRRRRFRKTLKKKYVEAPEIEKEVKRLLRVDNDAVSVKWEVISEDDELKINNKGVVVKVEKESHIDLAFETSNLDNQNLDIEQDIFGGTVSDSDEDETNINVLEMDENSHLSAEDSRLSDSNSVPQPNIMGPPGNIPKSILTQFTCDMFPPELEQQSVRVHSHVGKNVNQRLHISEVTEDQIDFGNQFTLKAFIKPEPANMYIDANLKLTKDQIFERIALLEVQINSLRTRREQQEVEIVNIENHALRQRFQEILDNLSQELLEIEQEHQQLQDMLNYKD